MNNKELPKEGTKIKRISNCVKRRDMVSIIKDYNTELEDEEVINLINEFIEAET